MALRKAGIPARIGIYIRPDGVGHAVAIAEGMILDNAGPIRAASSQRFIWEGVLHGGAVWMTRLNGEPIEPVYARAVQ